MLTSEDLIAKMAFASVKGLNRSLAAEILSRIGTEKAFFEASERQLSAVMGFSNKIFSRDYRESVLETARKESDFVTSRNIRTLYFSDNDYPRRLDECTDAPLLLYALGSLNLNECLTVGVVGTRHATPYGIDFTNRLVSDLKEKVEGTVAIVSGLAYGIDVAAHRAALKADCPTAAVLAHGLNTIYPSAHRNTAADMVKKGGLLLTDYRSSDTMHKGNFLARNRIVAGLSDCLVVVESAEKGGALVTARIAGDYDREVIALPGRTTDRYSAGCNRLIGSHRAHLITSADDLIELMNWERRPEPSVQQELFPRLNPDEEAVLGYIRERGEGQINLMTVDLNLSIGKLTAILIELEFKGLVTPYPGAKYRPA